MPKGYEEMRDQFYREKIKRWKARHKSDEVPADVAKKFHGAAQTKAAKIWNDKHPNNPVH